MDNQTTKAIYETLQVMKNAIAQIENYLGFGSDNSIEYDANKDVTSVFEGTLTRDAEVRMTKKGKQFIKMNLRLSKTQNNSIWANAQKWLRADDASINKLQYPKGTKIKVEGVLSLREYEGKQYNCICISKVLEAVKPAKEVKPAPEGVEDDGSF